MKILAIICLTVFFSGCSGISSSTRPAYVRDIPSHQRYYKVKRGDTLYGIGKRSGHGYKRLALWNNLSSPYLLFVGQKIRLFKPKQNVIYDVKQNTESRVEKKTRWLSQKSPILSNDNEKMLKFIWGWPLKGKILKNFSQTGNNGIDISGKFGQTVQAAADGKVVYSGQGLIGYGNLLIIKHNDSFLSAYGNNSRLLVKEGQRVTKGQAVAEVGRLRGSQTSLHFEIRKHGKPVDPMHYLPAI